LPNRKLKIRFLPNESFCSLGVALGGCAVYDKPMSESVSGKFWQVQVKGARKAHLTVYVDGQGSGTVALCGKELPADQRRGSAKVITRSAKDTCCLACSQWAGFVLKKPMQRKPKSNAEERLDALLKFCDVIDKTTFTDAQKEKMKRQALNFALYVATNSN